MTELKLNENEDFLHVLYVDDEECLLKVSKKILEMDGKFNVDIATSVEEAFEMLKNQSYDAVISDYEMPGKNGLQFLTELREKGNDIPFVIFTGKGREKVAIKALNLGADGYFSKIGDPETVYGELTYGINQYVERKDAKAKACREEKRLRAILDSSPDAITICDLNAKIVDCNDATLKQGGYTSKAQIIGRDGFEFITQKDQPKALEAMIRLVGQGIIAKVEITCLKGNGEEYPAELTVGLLKDGTGNPEGLVGVLRDISERQKTEDALRRNEEKYRSLFEHMLNGFAYCKMILDDEGKPIDFVYLEVNDAFEKLTGLKKEAVIGKKVTEAIPGIENANPELIDIYSRVASTGKEEQFEIFFKPLEIWLTISVYSPSKGYFIAVFDNITERKKTLEKLQFQACLLGAAGQAIVAVDAQGIIRYWNRAAEGLYGYSVSETVGHGAKEVLAALTSPQEADEIISREMTRQAWSSEMKAKRRDGSVISVIVNRAPIWDDNGEFIGVTSVATNISEQKWLETELSVSVDALLSSVKKVQELNEKLRVVGSLTRHDVRNKLATVAGYAYLLKKKHADQADILDAMSKMTQAVKEIGEIFDFAKIYEQLGAEELNYVDVEATLHEAVMLFSSSLNIEVGNECQGLVVLADSFLRQMFYNLIDDSAKHGEKVTKIRIYYEKFEQGQLRIIYEDDGVGIPLVNKPRLFQEGFSTGGTSGYGLFLIKKMLEVYGWTINETGKPNNGAQFIITIPNVNVSGKENYRIA